MRRHPKPKYEAWEVAIAELCMHMLQYHGWSVNDLPKKDKTMYQSLVMQHATLEHLSNRRVGIGETGVGGIDGRLHAHQLSG